MGRTRVPSDASSRLSSAVGATEVAGGVEEEEEEEAAAAAARRERRAPSSTAQSDVSPHTK